MNLALEFVTDFVTSYADDYGVSVPSDFNAQELLDSVNESLSLSKGFFLSYCARLSDFSLSLEVETTRILGI